MRKFMLAVIAVIPMALVMPASVAWAQPTADPPLFCLGGTPGHNQ